VTERRLDEETSELRDALARVMARNVELEQRIEALELEQNELGLDEVARSLVNAARLAEDGMARVAGGEDGSGVRYTIPTLDVAMRGTVSRRGDGLGIRFPGPDQWAAPHALSTITMTVAHVPNPPVEPELRGFRAGLEAIQIALTEWDRDRGRSAADEIVVQSSHLLGLRARWGDDETVASLRALAEAIRRFHAQTRMDLQPAARDRFAASSKALIALAERLRADSATREGLESIGSLLIDLAGAIAPDQD
jgi:hypothetical protein